MTDTITIDESGHVALPQRPEEPSLPPGEWIRKNLFSSPFNTILTFVFGAFALFAINILVDFVFDEERNWTAPATNARLLLTRAYPENQYLRMWVSVGFLAVLIGLSLGIWRAGGRVYAKRICTWLMTAGAFLALVGILGPFSTSDRIVWLVIAAVVFGIGYGLWTWLGERRTTASVHGVVVAFTALGLIVLSLWVVPYGNWAFAEGEVIAESGVTVAFSTQLPWTVMYLLMVGSYLLARYLIPEGWSSAIKGILALGWLLSPFIIVWVILRDPDLDWDHVISTDIPMFLAFAVGGGGVLYYLTKPELGEKGRLLAAGLLGVAGLMWISAFFGWWQMLQKARISFLLLALVAMLAPNFAGDRSTRLRLVWGWVGLMVLVHYIATMANTPSTIVIQDSFFLGGLTLTLFIAVTTLMFSFPLGVLLALGRTSTMPIFRVLSTIYIEVIRGVPLITILFFFSIMVNLFLPSNMEISETAAIVLGYTLFSAAYLAENVRGGLQSIRRGQFEAADALGLSGSQRTGFIILPQALRVSIPPLVGQAIATYKETSLVAIVGGFDLTRIGNQVISAQTAFLGIRTENLLVISFIYWVGAYSMSKYSQKLERDLGVGER